MFLIYYGLILFFKLFITMNQQFEHKAGYNLCLLLVLVFLTTYAKRLTYNRYYHFCLEIIIEYKPVSRLCCVQCLVILTIEQWMKIMSLTVYLH